MVLRSFDKTGNLDTTILREGKDQMKSDKMVRLVLVITVFGCLACRGTDKDPAQVSGAGHSKVNESASTNGPRSFEHLQLLDGEHWFVADSIILWKTDDGGRSWSMSYKPKPERDVRVYIRGVSFVSYQIGFLIDRERLYRTEDAGVNWSETGIVGDGREEYFLKNLCFIDSLHGWAVGAAFGKNPESAPYTGVVLRTTDGGQTWLRQQVDPPANDFANPSRWDVEDILFVNEKLGWAVGDCVLYWTIDGGDTWKLASIDSGSHSQVCTRVQFVDEKNGWITVRDSSDFLRTTDAGRHWKLLKGPGRFLGPSAEVVFLDRERGFGVNRALYKTGDGGKSWTISPESRADRGKEYVGIERARDGTLIALAFEVNTIVAFTSRDAGATWRSYHLHKSTGNIQ